MGVARRLCDPSERSRTTVAALITTADEIATIAERGAPGWGSEMTAQAAVVTSAVEEYDQRKAKGW